MNDSAGISAEQARKLISRKILCGKCGHGRILVWDKIDQKKFQFELEIHPPQHAIRSSLNPPALNKFWIAVHCAHYKRRIEHPNVLRQCGDFTGRNFGTQDDEGEHNEHLD